MAAEVDEGRQGSGAGQTDSVHLPNTPGLGCGSDITGEAAPEPRASGTVWTQGLRQGERTPSSTSKSQLSVAPCEW